MFLVSLLAISTKEGYENFYLQSAVY